VRYPERVSSSDALVIGGWVRRAAWAWGILLLCSPAGHAHARVRRHNAVASFTMTPASGPPPLLVQVDGSGSVPAHGTLVSWTWDWGDGSPVASGVTSSHTYAATGTYPITLTVDDSGDSLGPATTGVLTHNLFCLSAGNQPPTAQITSAGPLIGDTPLLVSFTGLGQEPSPPGIVLEHRWDFGDGSAPAVFSGLASGATSTASHTYTKAGFFTCTLRVMDPQNVWQEDTTTINPNIPGAPHAVLSAAPAVATPPLTVTVDGSASYDTRSGIASYRWDWGDLSTPAATVQASHLYPDVGTYTIVLTVTNGAGAVDSAAMDVSAAPLGKLVPTAHIQSAIPLGGHAPVVVTFLGHGHDDMDTLEHDWDFGDGTPPQILLGVGDHLNSSPSHLYTAPGVYTVTLRVRDAMKLSGARSMAITVTDPGSDTLGSRCGSIGIEALIPLFLLVLIPRARRCFP